MKKATTQAATSSGGDTAITFIVSGQSLPSGQLSDFSVGRVRSAVQVGARRGAGTTQRLTAQPGEDVVVVQIANGPALYLHPQDARDLMLAQAAPPAVASSRAASDTSTTALAAAVPDEVAVPAELSWPQLEAGIPGSATARGTTRDLLGKVWISALHVVTGLGKDDAAEFVASKVVAAVDGQVDTGLYRLARETLPKLKGSDAKVKPGKTATTRAQPLLVLVHGTFVETTSTFGKLWALHPTQVSDLFARYGDDGVYAFDHPTLGASPIANALALAQSLPAGARLHLVTHSRGGLVAEVLARACAVPDAVDDGAFAGTGYAQHAKDLNDLKALVKARRIAVDRVVRVACPARGTLLASTRLSAYLSVLKWGLELAQVPVAPELVDFLTEVARRRADPQQVPGLAAMMPDSPVVQWLNGPMEAAPGTLRVVAGDMQGDSVASWVKTLLADAFYWTDNDIVVQTRSMYGGLPRGKAAGGGASFLLDQGGSVNHFSYFANKTTAEAITRALLEDDPAGFRPIGPKSWSGDDASGVRAARPSAADAANRPAVFVLPGIVGSNLAVDGKRIWVGWRFFNNLKALDYDHPRGVVAEDGPVGHVYDDLMTHLGDSHDVHPFGYDWRRPIEDEAHRLADRITEALDARHANAQPVRILAHSMGGLVARTMKLERPEVWQRLMANDRSRFVMLGTPNAGSWAPMQVLSGDDSFGNTLVATGALFDDHGARMMMAAMPGFIQLQASLLGGSPDLAIEKSWQDLADQDLALVRRYNRWHSDERQLSVYTWGVPKQVVIDRAVALRRRLDEQTAAQAKALDGAAGAAATAADRAAASEAARTLLVVGTAGFTPAGVRTGEQGVEYLDAPQHGDGRVTLESALLPGVRTWRVDASHGDLANTKAAFDAYVQLLDSGDTSLLERVAAAPGVPTAAAGVRGGDHDVPPARLQPWRQSRVPRSDALPPSDIGTVFSASPSQPLAPALPASGQPALQVTLINGNLKFVSLPLMLGHYRALALTGTEKVMDGLLGGQMSRSLQAGLYASSLDSHQVFLNAHRDPGNPFAIPRPAAVIVVGLGEEGKMRGNNLRDTVRQATIAYAQRMAESSAAVATGFELAATLLGSGGTGVSVALAAQSIANGVHQANGRLARSGWPLVKQLSLIELYLDRATEAHHALRLLAASQAGAFVVDAQIRFGVGPLRRPPGFGYRGAPYDFIGVEQRADADSGSVIEFTLDSRRARSEVRAQKTQSRLVDELVRVGADERNRDVRIGRSLFNLLVPVALEPSLTGSDAVVMQLDFESARIPWEMLDSVSEVDAAAADARPWAVRTRMIRKLRTEQFREAPTLARSDHCALVIGAPKCDLLQYPPLPGAVEEAKAVAAVLETEAQIDSDALGVINALLERPYRIVHIAGHGKLQDVDDPTTGVVLTNGTVLGPSEIESMRTVPELAFINCCHLGDVSAGSNLLRNALRDKQPRFAASVAAALIDIGVRCVVVAGWAVADAAAKVFATTFYQALLRSENFLTAVGQAREAAWRCDPDGNTWAAYQCYGDPDWVYLQPGTRDTPPTTVEAGLPTPMAIVSPAGLAIALETIAVEAKYDAYDDDREIRRARRLGDVRQLDAEHAAAWGTQGAVAEAFALAYAETGSDDDAIRWYRTAVAAEDGSAQMRASEQLANHLSRRGERLQPATLARSEIKRAIAMLEGLVALKPTSERESLLGSAYKRLAMVEDAQGPRASAARKQAATAKMAVHYRNAQRLAADAGADNLYYPAMNRLGAELALQRGVAGWRGFDAGDLAAIRQSLKAKVTHDPDFWSIVGVVELDVYEAIAGRTLATKLADILRRLDDIKQRVPAPRQWESVEANARFVLAGYLDEARNTSEVERKAVKDLLQRLGLFKGQSFDQAVV